MNAEEARDLLAEYLGDELDSVQQHLFEDCLAKDADLAAEVDGLRRALAAMNSLDAPGGVTARREAHQPLRHWSAAMMRYAAVILFAFSAGYLTRNTADPNELASKPGIHQSTGSPEWGALETRVAAAYTQNPGRSGLARSLLALAQAAQRP
ncbi:MAG: hypothetical protein GY842_28465 [bacterium]|nr:hypothetical protein [bacterium]